MFPGREVSFFSAVERVGEGGFGDVWKVQSTEDDRYYALKLETPKAKRQSLRFEASVLKDIQRSNRFPRFVMDGPADGGGYFLVQELLGANLHTIVNKLPGSVVLQPYIAKLADEMLSCLEMFHACGYVHRDIKPANFVVRLSGECPICLIDYGISRKYRGSDARDRLAAVGSPTFASPRVHERADLGRCDDLISWVYTVRALSQYGLPWAGMNNDVMSIGRLKTENSIVSLFEPFGCNFEAVAAHIDGLSFTEAPDYAFMHEQLASAMAHTPNPFEWMAVSAPGFKSGGEWDPTGFLLSCSPFLRSKGKKCVVQ